MWCAIKFSFTKTTLEISIVRWMRVPTSQPNQLRKSIEIVCRTQTHKPTIQYLNCDVQSIRASRHALAFAHTRTSEKACSFRLHSVKRNRCENLCQLLDTNSRCSFSFISIWATDQNGSTRLFNRYLFTLSCNILPFLVWFFFCFTCSINFNNFRPKSNIIEILCHNLYKEICQNFIDKKSVYNLNVIVIECAGDHFSEKCYNICDAIFSSDHSK